MLNTLTDMYAVLSEIVFNYRYIQNITTNPFELGEYYSENNEDIGGFPYYPIPRKISLKYIEALSDENGYYNSHITIKSMYSSNTSIVYHYNDVLTSVFQNIQHEKIKSMKRDAVSEFFESIYSFFVDGYNSYAVETIFKKIPIIGEIYDVAVQTNDTILLMEEINNYNSNLDFLDDITYKTNEARAFQLSGCVIYTNTGEGDLAWMPIMRVNIKKLNDYVNQFHSENVGYKFTSDDVIKYLKGECNNQMTKEIKDYVNWYIQTNN